MALSLSSVIAGSNAVRYLAKALVTDNGFGAASCRNWLWPKLRWAGAFFLEQFGKRPVNY